MPGFPWLEDVRTEILTWPSYNKNPKLKQGAALATIAAVVPQKDLKIDFEAGVARRNGAKNTDLSQGLDDVGEEFVRSLDLYTDTPCRINVPDDEGQSKAGAITNDLTHITLRDCRVKEMDIITGEPAGGPARAILMASTQPEMAMELDGPPLRQSRIAVDLEDVHNDEPTAINANDWNNGINWTPPAVVETEFTNPPNTTATSITQDNSAQNLWIPSDASCSLQIKNNGTVAIGVSAKAFAHEGLDYQVGPRWPAPLPGWTESSPKIVDADENRILDVAGALDGVGAGASVIRFDVKVTGDNSTDVPYRAGFVADAP